MCGAHGRSLAEAMDDVAALAAKRADSRPVGKQQASGLPPDDASICVELLDKLDERRVSGELLASWARQEEEVGRRLSELGSPPALPAKVRQVVLRCLHGQTSLANLAQSGAWFDAVLLLDRFCLEQEVAVSALPVACTAIVNLIRKTDSSQAADSVAGLKFVAEQAAQCLRTSGYEVSVTFTAQELAEQEVAVLEALEWKIYQPSVNSWLSLLYDRLDVLTRQSRTPTIEWALSQARASAGTLLFHQAVYAPLSPRSMANGLFCLFLVVACWVPLDSMRPDEVSESEWEALFASSRWGGVMPQRQAMPADKVGGLQDLIEVVSGRRFADLQADAHAILLAMRRIAEDLTEAQAARQATCVQI